MQDQIIPSIMKNRPPHVRFEGRAKEQRQHDGSILYPIVDYALITPTGTKDVHEKVVEDWFKQMDMLERMERWDPTWTAHYKTLYKAWQDKQFVPLVGTPIANWPVASNAQAQVMRAINVHTVEEMADANEETIGRLGMGGRRLKQMAQEWIKAKGSGTTELIQQNDALKLSLEAAEEQNKLLREQVASLKALTIAQNMPQGVGPPTPAGRPIGDHFGPSLQAEAAKDFDAGIDRILS